MKISTMNYGWEARIATKLGVPFILYTFTDVGTCVRTVSTERGIWTNPCVLFVAIFSCFDIGRMSKFGTQN